MPCSSKSARDAASVPSMMLRYTSTCARASAGFEGDCGSTHDVASRRRGGHGDGALRRLSGVERVGSDDSDARRRREWIKSCGPVSIAPRATAFADGRSFSKHAEDADGSPSQCVEQSSRPHSDAPTAARKAFQGLATICKQGALALDRPSSTALHSIDAARADLVALSGALVKQTTACSLACAPPIRDARGWDAVDGTTTGVRDLAGKVIHAASGLGTDGVLAKELRWASQTLLEALGMLADAHAACMAIESPAPSLRKAALTANGMVWSATERLGASSVDERAAVVKSMRSLLETIDDGLHDVSELLASRAPQMPGRTDAPVDEDDGAVSDDSFDLDDDLTSNVPLSADEHARASAAHMLLRLSRHLLRRLIATLAGVSTSPPDATLIDLHQRCSQLTAVQDELAGDLYAPQRVPDIGESASKLATTARGLCDAADAALPTASGPLDKAMASLDLSSSPFAHVSASPDARSWFAECAAQCGRAEAKILALCNGDSSSAER